MIIPLQNQIGGNILDHFPVPDGFAWIGGQSPEPADHLCGLPAADT